MRTQGSCRETRGFLPADGTSNAETGRRTPNKNEKFALLPLPPHRTAQPVAHEKHPAPARGAARVGTQAARRGLLSADLPQRRRRRVLKNPARLGSIRARESAALDHQHKNRIAPRVRPRVRPQSPAVPERSGGQRGIRALRHFHDLKTEAPRRRCSSEENDRQEKAREFHRRMVQAATPRSAARVWPRRAPSAFRGRLLENGDRAISACR